MKWSGPVQNMYGSIAAISGKEKFTEHFPNIYEKYI